MGTGAYLEKGGVWFFGQVEVLWTLLVVSSPDQGMVLVAGTYSTHLPSFVIIRPQLFEIFCYVSFFWPDLSMVKNYF